MTQTPQHPAKMSLKPGDVIRYEGGCIFEGFTVGKTYPALENGYLRDDFGHKHQLSNIDSTRRFTLVSRADDGRWFPVSTRSDWEYQINANGLPEGRPRKPKLIRVAAECNYGTPGLPQCGCPNSKWGYVTLTDGKPDWTTFSEKEDL